MTQFSKLAIAAAVAGLALGTASGAFAKAHDQGKADGVFCPICGTTNPQNARDQINTLTAAGALDGHGVSAIQNHGQRGDLNNDGAKAGGISCKPTGSPLPCPAQ